MRIYSYGQPVALFFFGFLRSGEFFLPDSGLLDPKVHMSLSDLTYMATESERNFHLKIKVAKTDQFRQGTTVVLGATGAALCPVAALLDFLGKRGNAPGPLFMFQDGSPLRRSFFIAHIQKALDDAGLQGAQFYGHSFRIGAATSASDAGIPETTIKILQMAEHGIPTLHSAFI